MIKLRSFIVLFILYVLFFISINYNINIFYPYYLIKDLLMYPVSALASNKDLPLKDEFKDSKISNLEEEIKELKKLTNINNTLVEYDYLNATVIERNREYWFNTITINKGKNDGITIDMAVIDSNGLLGRISNVRDNSSVVKLITTNDVNNNMRSKLSTSCKIY